MSDTCTAPLAHEGAATTGGACPISSLAIVEALALAGCAEAIAALEATR